MMKKILTLLLVVTSFAAFANEPITTTSSPKAVKIQVSYSFAGIVDGYDHDCKTELYIDGKLVATSKPHKQSKPAKVSAKVSMGKHEVKVINYALYEGKWEVHTIANNYSIDCTWSDAIDMQTKKNVITILFDLDRGTSRVE
jgi:hypothetical protein